MYSSTLLNGADIVTSVCVACYMVAIVIVNVQM